MNVQKNPPKGAKGNLNSIITAKIADIIPWTYSELPFCQYRQEKDYELVRYFKDVHHLHFSLGAKEP